MTARSALSLALAAVAVAALAAATIAGVYARHVYVQRAQLQLTPTHESAYAADNARLPPAAGRRVVMFGDSRISHWYPRPDAGDLEIVWRGIGGESTAQMRHRYDTDTRGIGASAVVVQAGINDLSAGVAAGKPGLALEQAFANLRAMAESSRRNGIDVIMLTVVPPSTPPAWRRVVWSDDIYGLVDELNDRIRGLRARGVRVIDAQRVLCGSDDRVPARLARDTMHLRADAYVLLNEKLAAQLQEYDVALQ